MPSKSTFTPSTTPQATKTVAKPFPICLKTNGVAAVATDANTCASYQGIKAALNAKVAAIGNDLFTLSHLYGAALRLAFHDAGEVDIRTTDLGPDGCLGDTFPIFFLIYSIRFIVLTLIGDPNDNKGLYEAVSPVLTIMEPIFQQYCDKISRADFIVLFAKLVVEKSDPTGFIQIPFQYGRIQNTQCSAGA